MKFLKLAAISLSAFCSCSSLNDGRLINGADPKPNEAWITKADGSVLFQKQDLESKNSKIDFELMIDKGIKFQNMVGFGFALTQGSAQVLEGMNPSARKSLLVELYSNNQSVVRISIGASDLSNSVYSYNEMEDDVEMSRFSFKGPDQTYLFPILKEILAINPTIKIIATPWTAPTWMKSNKTWIGGSLKKEYYQAYANYFTTYVKQMAEMGIEIWAITPQNEPLNDKNEPSMLMTAEEQLEFIDKYLGPTFEREKIQTEIIAYDHNCDEPAYPISVLNGSKYASGAAFHLYGGDIAAMGEVHESTNKDVYFTEQFVSSKGNFGGDLEWHAKNVLIGSCRNWSRSVIEWNLATGIDFGPKTPGGCDECLGAVTIKNTQDFERNVSYYLIQHLSKFIKPDAFRIASNSSPELPNVAFLNPDGSISVLLFNTTELEKTIKIKNQEHQMAYTIPSKSLVSVVL